MGREREVEDKGYKDNKRALIVKKGERWPCSESGGGVSFCCTWLPLSAAKRYFVCDQHDVSLVPGTDLTLDLDQYKGGPHITKKKKTPEIHLLAAMTWCLIENIRSSHMPQVKGWDGVIVWAEEGGKWDVEVEL